MYFTASPSERDAIFAAAMTACPTVEFNCELASCAARLRILMRPTALAASSKSSELGMVLTPSHDSRSRSSCSRMKRKLLIMPSRASAPSATACSCRHFLSSISMSLTPLCFVIPVYADVLPVCRTKKGRLPPPPPRPPPVALLRRRVLGDLEQPLVFSAVCRLDRFGECLLRRFPVHFSVLVHVVNVFHNVAVKIEQDRKLLCDPNPRRRFAVSCCHDRDPLCILCAGRHRRPSYI